MRQRPNVLSHTPGRRPPHVTDFRVNSVTLGWVGAPKERAPFRCHDEIAGFADRCLTSTRIADQGLAGGPGEHADWDRGRHTYYGYNLDNVDRSCVYQR